MGTPLKHTGQPKISRLEAASRRYLASKSGREVARLLGHQAPAAARRPTRRKAPQASNQWQPWEIELLGKKPDRDVARQIGRSHATVKNRRKSLRIPSLTPMRRWTEDENRLLGTLPDAELARRFNRGLTAIQQQRMKLRISFHASDAELIRRFGEQGRKVIALKRARQLSLPNRYQPWEDALLGKMSDADAARQTGRKLTAIQSRRGHLGIPMFNHVPRKPLRVWTAREIKLLGTMADSQLAHRLRREKHQVLQMRLALKIPSFKFRRWPRQWKPAELRLLGRFTDLEVAQRLGCPQNIVRHKRITLRIGAHHPMPSYRLWTPAEDKVLGTQADTEIARRLNRTRESVIRRRLLLKIPSSRPPQKLWTRPEEKLLGTQSDEKIARQLNRSPRSVAKRRYRLKLPAFARLHTGQNAGSI